MRESRRSAGQQAPDGCRARQGEGECCARQAAGPAGRPALQCRGSCCWYPRPTPRTPWCAQSWQSSGTRGRTASTRSRRPPEACASQRQPLQRDDVPMHRMPCRASPLASGLMGAFPARQVQVLHWCISVQVREWVGPDRHRDRDQPDLCLLRAPLQALQDRACASLVGKSKVVPVACESDLHCTCHRKQRMQRH